MNTIFNSLVSSAPSIAFNTEWSHANGYLNGASEGQYAPVLELGHVVTTIDNFDRKVLIIGCGKTESLRYSGQSNIVVFQRYNEEFIADERHREGVLFGNFPRGIVIQVQAIAASGSDEIGTVGSHISNGDMKNLLAVIDFLKLAKETIA